MSDEEDSLLPRGVKRALASTQRLRKPLGRPTALVRRAGDSLILQRLEEDVGRLLRALTEPENAQRLQTGLAHLAQFAMETGFVADPQAGQLYKLVAWLEEEHGRAPVLQRVAAHVAATEARLVGALGSLVGAAGGPVTPEDVARRMHEMREVASSDLLDLLCGLAAIEAGEEPPVGSVDERVAFFEGVMLPDEFGPLAAMAVGRPGAFDAVEKPKKTSLLRRVRGKPREDEPQRGLARFVPSLDDPHLRFLTLSHLFFLQSYLTRNLVEALPDLLEMANVLDNATSS